VQHVLSEKLSKLLENVPDEKKNLWIKASLNVLKKEWNQIDYYRINKFMYLANQILIQILQNLKKKKWNYKVKLTIELKRIENFLILVYQFNI
jgi:Nucleolar protein,Nop52